MTKNLPIEATANFENSVPFFWLLAPWAKFGEEAAETFQRNIDFAKEETKEEFELKPVWATANEIVYELNTMWLRDFSDAAARGDSSIIPTLIDPPYAGHHSTIADYAEGQSLVETLQASGLRRLLCIDWKSASAEMKDYNIDIYLAEINAVVDDLGGRVNLIGLCQGGWMAAMFAARYPYKVATLTVAGAPLDCDAGDGFVKKIAKEQPMAFFEELVNAGGGRMRGKFMLAGWKSMHPEEHYFKTHVDLYENVEDPAFVKKREEFERWYENPLDLPGRWYLQAIRLLFKDNAFFKGDFVALGRKIALKDIICPTFLLAGEGDDITPSPQVFSAEEKLGTPKDKIVKKLVPGGHIGLFMGSKTLKNFWPDIAAWIKRECPDA
ncbi:PHB de-polymerase domain protein [Methylocella silvestris BL2]|uniref:PHB de-polymerase domain protein n=1 Tax=Methylocella silvestris (strain DSM 15510 / CIP 108128 / LMG 27833 / NCIMB 13906 / BL2) TaxID=395965 RepID=B8ERN6_METSB|nr:alpha/beta fold hydrolase [Methylocella silvestris]ACK51088.1 PHB de-polymerase domain protein [Methylocella silvestris BL2]